MCVKCRWKERDCAKVEWLTHVDLQCHGYSRHGTVILTFLKDDLNSQLLTNDICLLLEQEEEIYFYLAFSRFNFHSSGSLPRHRVFMPGVGDEAVGVHDQLQLKVGRVARVWSQPTWPASRGQALPLSLQCQETQEPVWDYNALLVSVKNDGNS